MTKMSHFDSCQNSPSAPIMGFSSFPITEMNFPIPLSRNVILFLKPATFHLQMEGQMEQMDQTCIFVNHNQNNRHGLIPLAKFPLPLLCELCLSSPFYDEFTVCAMYIVLRSHYVVRIVYSIYSKHNSWGSQEPPVVQRQRAGRNASGTIIV